MTPLFRPEAVRAQQQSWLGGVQLTRPLPLSWLVIGVAALALSTAAFLGTAKYTRKAQLNGVLALDRGLVRLTPVAPGRVLQRLVQEGQSVQAGSLLFVLAQDRDDRDDAAVSALQRSVATRQRSLASSEAQHRALAQVRLETLDRRLIVLSDELTRLVAEHSMHARRLALARQSRQRLAALQAQSFISPAQLQAKDEDVLALEAQSEALERQRDVLARERVQVEGERREIPLTLTSVLNSLQRERAELEREQTLQSGERHIEVRAPQDGVVDAVLAEPGQMVSMQVALATIIPVGSTTRAQLFATSREVASVKTGQTVRLRFEAFPYQKHGHWMGRILQVSRTPLSPVELGWLAGVSGINEPMYRVTVALDPARGAQAAWQLNAGMRLSADVQLERRRLIEWLFEPILGLEARL